MKWHISFKGTAGSTETASLAAAQLEGTGLVEVARHGRKVSFRTKQEVGSDDYLLLWNIVSTYFDMERGRDE